MDLLILGASARAAAFSALRIGLRPTCIDLFADADLASACPVVRVEPDRLSRRPGRRSRLGLPPMPWLYTGAIENRPDLVDRISARHPLLGNRAETAPSGPRPDRPGRGRAATPAWPRQESGSILRGFRSTAPGSASRSRRPEVGGSLPGSARSTDHRRPVYYQERVEGLPLSAIFVGDASAGRFLGLTRQFVGKPGNPFAYRGSLGPWPVAAEVLERVERLGQAIGSRFGLVGLFGIDLILKGEHPWPVEVNPRYTASVEVLEWALGRSLLDEHLSACGEPIPQGPRWSGPPTFASKAIVFADRAFEWPWDSIDRPIDPDTFPELADIPQAGTVFRPGDPVVTVFARGDSPEECRRALAAPLRAWRGRIRQLPTRLDPSNQETGG